VIDHGHEVLNEAELDEFIRDPHDKCPRCGEPMTQSENPIKGSDSWWFTCRNKHALWIGK
jgi:hypothetical protein